MKIVVYMETDPHDAGQLNLRRIGGALPKGARVLGLLTPTDINEAELDQRTNELKELTEGLHIVSKEWPFVTTHDRVGTKDFQALLPEYHQALAYFIQIFSPLSEADQENAYAAILTTRGTVSLFASAFAASYLTEHNSAVFGLHPEKNWVLIKAARSYENGLGYAGPTYDAANLPRPTEPYTEEEAERVSAILSSHNPVGFVRKKYVPTK